jgi:hypothetical protein
MVLGAVLLSRDGDACFMVGPMDREIPVPYTEHEKQTIAPMLIKGRKRQLQKDGPTALIANLH